MRKLIPDVVNNQTLAILAPEASVAEAARLMRDRRIGAVLVTESNRLKGILTERDIAYRVVAEGRDPERMTVGEAMTPDPAVINPNATALDALQRMNDNGYRHLPILSDGRLVGIVSRRDFFGEETAIVEHQTRLWQKL